MICPKCGAMVNDDVKECDNCGYEFETPTAAAETDGSEYTANAPALIDAFKKTHRTISLKKCVAYTVILAIAVTIVIFSFYGAYYISAAGRSLNSMKSSGTSIFGTAIGIDNSLYMYIGAAVYGLAYVARAIGIALAAISTYIGIGLVKKHM